VDLAVAAVSAIQLTDEQHQQLVREARARVGRGNRVLVAFGSSEYPQREWCVYQRASDMSGFHWVLRTSGDMASVHEHSIDWLKLHAGLS
jgi:hypothetical protein